MKKLSSLVLGILLVTLLAACNINTPDMTPTPEVLISDTPTISVTETPSPSSTPSTTPTSEINVVPVIVATLVPTQSDLQPTSATTPTETPSSCAVTVQENDTLTIILYREACGNAITPGLINAVVALNDNLFNPDILPPVGSSLLIPRPSPTPIPEGADMTATASSALGIQIIGDQTFVQGQEFGCHEIQENERVIGIMEEYNTTLEVLSQQNQNLNWAGCDFTNPSGGPNCNPIIREGQCIVVPFPTRTPIPTSTPSGRETATPTPTYPPARTFYPPQGAIAAAGRVELRWVSVGILQPSEVYLVEVADRTANTIQTFETTLNSFTLPDSLIPTDGQVHTIEWRITVGYRNPDGSYRPIGGVGDYRSFQWRSR